MVEWTPQNDLLGDSRVRAFVTHGGLNSIYEVGLSGLIMPTAQPNRVMLLTAQHLCPDLHIITHGHFGISVVTQPLKNDLSGVPNSEMLGFVWMILS